MRRFRFHIGTLVILVLVIGVGVAALRESSRIWDSSTFTLTLGVLLVSVLLSIHRSEAKRAFWIGFALFGWSYLGLSLVQSIESRLLTTKGLAYLDSKVPGRPSGATTLLLSAIGSYGSGNQIQNIAFTVDGTKPATPSQVVVKVWDTATGKILSGWGGTTENFIRTGHSLLALVAAWLGGHVSRRLSRGSRPPEASAAEGPAT